MAKDLLEENGIPFIYKDVTKSANIMLKHWMSVEHLETVPQVFIDGNHIGGYDDLLKHLSP